MAQVRTNKAGKPWNVLLIPIYNELVQKTGVRPSGKEMADALQARHKVTMSARNVSYAMATEGNLLHDHIAATEVISEHVVKAIQSDVSFAKSYMEERTKRLEARMFKAEDVLLNLLTNADTDDNIRAKVAIYLNDIDIETVNGLLKEEADKTALDKAVTDNTSTADSAINILSRILKDKGI